MNPLKLSSVIRLAVLRAALRAGAYLLRKAIAPAIASAMKSGSASIRSGGAANKAGAGRVIDGEYRRVDLHHHNNC